MFKQLQAVEKVQRCAPTGSLSALWVLGALVILPALACGGGRASSGDHPGQLNGKFQITPTTATTIVNQSLRFMVITPEGGGAIWTVLPTSGGTIDTEGLFTASASPGQYQVVAMWNKDVRYTATATVWVVPSPQPAHIALGMVQASGNIQGNGSIRNATVAGEPVAIQQSSSASGTIQVRHGFHLPPAD